ncbi:phage tail protein, partial [Pseudosulfitobacter pseudonitzschiae]
MPFVGAAITAISGFVAGFAATQLGTFLTTNIFGRLLTSVALSALKAALVGKPKSRQAGIRTQQTQTGGITPASFVLGKYATEGQFVCPPMSHGYAGKTPNAYLTYVIELGDIPGQELAGVILDGERVELGEDAHADYGRPILGRFTNHAWIKYYNGSQTAADPMLLAKYGDFPDRPWTAAKIGTGLCYAILTFRFNREIFSNFPKVRFEVVGIPLYDPRKDSSVGGAGNHRWADRSTWEPSENVAVQVYNILCGIDLGGGNIWGGAAEVEDLPLSNWWAAMNEADYAVPLNAGGTEPQWRASYEIFVDDEPASVIEDMLRGCAGRMVENGGVWKIRLGGPGLPLYYFTDADVIISEPEENIPFDASREAFNAVQAVYPEPQSLWEPKDAPALLNATYQQEDGGQRRVADLTLTATPYPLQVQRVLRAYLQDDRRFRQHVLNLPSDASMLEPLDVAAWSSQANGYITKSWEINSQVDPLTSGTTQFRLREVDPTDYDWSPEFELPSDFANIITTPLPEQPVAGFAVSGVAVLDADGNERLPALKIEWDGDGQDDVRGIRWEVRLAATEELVIRGSTDDVASGEQLVQESILPKTHYQARGRWIVDRPTSWTDWYSATTTDTRLTVKDFVDELRAQIEAAFARHDQ